MISESTLSGRDFLKVLLTLVFVLLTVSLSYSALYSFSGQQEFAGTFNATTVDLNDNSGNLGLGYGNATPESLEVFYRMDRSISGDGGVVQDYSGKKTGAETSGGVTTGADGVLSTRAFSFDGYNDFLDLDSSLSGKLENKSFTWSTWIKSSGTGSPEPIVAFQNSSSIEAGIYVYGDKISYFDGEYHNTSSVIGDGWNHVSTTYDNSTDEIKIFVDGEEKTSFTTDRKIETGGNFTVATDGTKWFNGELDELRILSENFQTSSIVRENFYSSSGDFEGNYNESINTGEGEGAIKVGVSSSNMDNSNRSFFELTSGLEVESFELDDGKTYRNYTLNFSGRGDTLKTEINFSTVDVSETPLVENYTVYTEERPLVESLSLNYDPIEAGQTLNITITTDTSVSGIETVNLNLTDAEGNLEVNREMREYSTGKYFYNTTIINETSNYGKWDLNISAVDSYGLKGYNSTEFEVSESKPPLWSNQSQQKDNMDNGTTNILEAYGYDEGVLEEAILATNETGSWENKSSYGSPLSIGTSRQKTQTEFYWDNSSIEEELIGWKIWYRDNLSLYNSTDVEEFFVNGKDINVSNVYIPDSTIVEGKTVQIKTDLSNPGKGEIKDAEIKLEIETYETGWKNIENRSKTVSIPSESEKIVSFDWEPFQGPYRFKINADPNDTIEEMNESNNKDRLQRDVSSYQIFYGGSDSEIRLGPSNSKFTSWPAAARGEIFFSDTDSSYRFSDLKPLNGTDDLSEASRTLEMVGHNDSISEEYDKDDDGEADYTRCINLGGQEKCEIPFTNSTNTSNFQTGIMHDSEDRYNGSQNLVFLTTVNVSKQGKYGVYDYEARIPSALQRLKESTDKIEIYTQLK